MSTRSLQSDTPARLPDVGSLLGRLSDHAVTTPLQLVAFWSAIVLPFAQLQLLVSGVSTTSEATTFGALLALNLLALLVGHPHNRD